MEAAIEHVSTTDLAQVAPWRARTASISSGGCDEAAGAGGGGGSTSLAPTAVFFRAVSDQQLGLVASMLRAVPASLTAHAMLSPETMRRAGQVADLSQRLFVLLRMFCCDVCVVLPYVDHSDSCIWQARGDKPSTLCHPLCECTDCQKVCPSWQYMC